MTDLEMCVKLARFMGWPEMKDGEAYPGGPESDRLWYRHTDGAVFFASGDPGPWSPLTDPAQTAMVMAEAVRRFEWRFEMHVGIDGWCRIWDRWGRRLLGESPRFEGDPVGGWSRSLCLAVLTAAAGS